MEHFKGAAADLDQVQNAKFTFRRVHTEHKVEGGIVPVNQLVVGASDETASSYMRNKSS